jgi:Cof subfamily protein (haloacid dehalogenase superfamily)
LKLNAPGVYMQGLIIHNADGTIRHQQTMDLALARRLIEFADGFDAMLIGYSGLGTVTRAEHPQLERVASHLEPIPEVVGPLENVLDRAGINKFLFVGEVPAIRAIRAALTAHFNGAATIVQAVPDMLEVLPPGASKGAGLKWLIDDLGIPAQQVMAIGDAENDVEMLRLVGVGVAMGNANPKARAAARYVVADHDHDGVGEAIEKFILSSNRR